MPIGAGIWRNKRRIRRHKTVKKSFSAAAAGLAMPAAFFYGLARGGINRPGVAPHSHRLAVGAMHFVVEFFYKLFKFFAA